MSKSVSIKVPGKLMIAGEYAVLEPNEKLIVTAVNRFIYVKIAAANKNSLTLENFRLYDMTWNYENNKVNIEVEDDRTSFVHSALDVTLTYLSEQQISLKPISITIHSDLDDESGIKYGLGSSAAVVTGVVSALLTKFLPEKPSNELVFKLAAIAHVQTQGSGSGADIAASTYGGIILYSSFQANWLLSEIKQQQISTLINKEWKYLYIEQIDFPKQWQMIVGWTGTPASTGSLVGQILELKEEHPSQFQQFIKNSSQAVEAIIQGIYNQDIKLFYNGINKNRKCLAIVGKQANVEVETPLLEELALIAKKCGGIGKLSGAGGGDCGIAFSPLKDELECMKNAWELAGIKPLEITNHYHGAVDTN